MRQPGSQRRPASVPQTLRRFYPCVMQQIWTWISPGGQGHHDCNKVRCSMKLRLTRALSWRAKHTATLITARRSPAGSEVGGNSSSCGVPALYVGGDPVLGIPSTVV
eukprot:2276998-Rhodomonas_salina.5